MSYFDLPSSGSIFDNTEISNSTDAVITSVNNLILGQKNSRIYKKKQKGINLEKYLFDEITFITAHSIMKDVENVLIRFEPRIKDLIVEVAPEEDNNQYLIKLNYKITDLLQAVAQEIPIKRIR